LTAFILLDNVHYRSKPSLHDEHLSSEVPVRKILLLIALAAIISASTGCWSSGGYSDPYAGTGYYDAYGNYYYY
jgi:hypothetical protein